MEPFLTCSSHHEMLHSRVRASAVGPHQRLTLPHLIRLFQEAAMRNTDRLGISTPQLMQQYGLTWVLHRQQIVANHWPELGERVTVVTVPTRIERRLLTYRDFYLLDSKDNITIRSTSVWSVMSLSSHRIKPLPEAIVSSLDDLPPPATHQSLPKTKPEAPREVVSKRSFRVDFAHLDFNNHLTNPAFAELMLEPLGLAHLSQQLPATADISYHHEARYGDALMAVTAAVETGTAHGLLRDGETLATMHTTWEPVKE